MSRQRNRRNYYRVLHVQPDAPQAVLKSSYRALMLSMASHPDRGGDHWNAALINEAYAVLSDSTRRAEYDLTLDLAPARNDGSTSESATDSVPPIGAEAGEATGTVRDAAAHTVCLFCGCERSVADPRSAGRLCLDCRSPLVPAGAPHVEAVGRRGARRVAKRGEILCFVRWPQPDPIVGRLVDLSPVGSKFASDTALDVHHIIKLEGPLVQAVGRVASCSEDGQGFSIGVEFYTVRFAPARGTFLSTKA
jgi:hypothetical protein